MTEPSPEIEALFDQFKAFPTSNQYEEILSCVTAAISEQETSSSPSDSHSLEAFLSRSSPTPAFNELQALLAASALITKLEAICRSGVLPLAEEIATRELIVKAARAFQFDTQAERSEA